ncbi:class I SAM-dependent RNA methyltransferase [Hyphomicrobium sp.]|uniref:class I SAM-dependent RNA methyltransferase n=1 Tax=Hyphomicrobium sp. TaxID=82 RepID=UPI000FBA5E02|nr:class I SAM-dependent RNA methyltransferase [Hyphomicrobium sp.]RUP10041.1 MAG: class I SAM-dependent RNA methyltransferase [Hyphomicrobium sp.]
MADARELSIRRIGAQGDGVADLDGEPVFVPFTLPGEQIEAEVDGDRARLLRVLKPSPERITPVCKHFGKCGGCSVQHMAPDTYAEWKRNLVVDAFRSRGLEPVVDPLQRTAGKRRRAVMKAERTPEGVALGFYEASSHDLVAIEECPVLEPKIVAALPGVGNLIAPLLSKRGEARVAITLTKSGLDVEISGIERQLTPEVRTALATKASEMKLVRLVVRNEVVVETLHPFLSFGTADVILPPGVFVQAVEEAETEIARRVVAASGKAKAVADLFCGLGAFTFPLAARSRVSAFDGDKAAVAALTSAAKKTSGLKPVTATVRDLFREPLSPLELKEHDAVVFDPPRAGAEAQSQRLARSKVKTVVAVSCNPATLARDARHLVDGGYKIESVTPIDQFLYSAHVEVVAVLRR